MIEFKLEQVLKEIDLNMNKLAVLANVRPNTVNDLVNGKTKRIELETLDRLLYAINQSSLMRNIGKYYQIQDLIQFDALNNEFEKLQKPLISPDIYKKIKSIFEHETIYTTISGLNNISAKDFLLLYEDYFKKGVERNYEKNGFYEDQIISAFLAIESMLKSHGLIDYYDVVEEDHYSFMPSKKGLYFINQLKSDTDKKENS
jgi:plasmid maintenance system antidote protein VapI